MSEPRVSILLPVFDASATLSTCLRSIERQSEVDFECVVIDDGSRDASLDIAAAFARRDPRFRVHARPHAGLVPALEAGRALCRAPLIARMDADDWMHRERLERQCAALDAQPELAGVGCHVRTSPRDTLSEGRRSYEAWLNSIASAQQLRAEAWVECPLAHPSLVMRREVLGAHGYRDLGWPEDYDLVLRLLAAGHALGVVPRRLLGWRDTPERLSRTSRVYEQEQFTACKAAHLVADFLAHDKEYVLWGYGGTGRALRAALAAHGRHPSYIVELHPGRIGQHIHGAPVIEPAALSALHSRRIVASVAGAGPRAQIRAALSKMGFRELRDFVCAA